MAFVMGMHPLHVGSYSRSSGHLLSKHNFLLLLQPCLAELIKVLAKIFDLLFAKILITHNEIVRVFFDHRFLDFENFGNFCFRHCLI